MKTGVIQQAARALTRDGSGTWAMSADGIKTKAVKQTMSLVNVFIRIFLGLVSTKDKHVMQFLFDAVRLSNG